MIRTPWWLRYLMSSSRYSLPQLLIFHSDPQRFHSASLENGVDSTPVMPSEPNQRRQRASRACDFCHARGLRCLQALSRTGQAQESRADCVTCTNYGVKCTMNRPIRRRGRKPTVPGLDDLDDGQPPAVNQDPGFKSLRTIRRLIRIYCNTMYQC